MARDIFSELEQRFDELRRDLLGPATEAAGGIGYETRMPAVDVIDEENQYVVTAELPGLDKKDIQLDVDEEGVRIRARRKEQEENSSRGYLRRERSSATFERAITFPEEVSPDGARAQFKNGILEVTVPKTAPEKRKSRSLEID